MVDLTILKSKCLLLKIIIKLKSYSLLIASSRLLLKPEKKVLALMEAQPRGISITLLVGPIRRPGQLYLAKSQL